MTFNEIRELHGRRPFEPFDLQLADGRALTVEQPDFLGRSANERQIAVGRPDGVIETIDIQQVVALTARGNGARQKRRSR